MKIKVTTEKLENSESSLKGFASIVFNDRYVLNNITIRENKEGQLYVMMPQMNTFRKNEDGISERTKTDAFFPTTKEAREDLSICVLSSFKNNESATYQIDSKLELEGARAYLMDRGTTKAKASLSFGDFACPAVYIMESKEGNLFLSNTATERTVKVDDKYEKKICRQLLPNY